MKLKKVSPKQKGLAKLPKPVRNKMGYMEEGGRATGGFGGSSVSQRSLYQTRKNEKAWSDRKNSLETQIEAAKGTPEAKPLVEAYRSHMKTMRNGGKLERQDKRSKKSDTALNKLRLKAAQKNYKKKTEKYGSISEAAETGPKAVKRVTKAEDRLKKRAAIAGRDPESTVQKTSSSRRPKPSSPPKRKPAKLPEVRRAGSSSGARKAAAQFNEAREKGRLRASKKAGCYGRNCP